MERSPTPVRTTVVWCPDWPVVATGADPHEPVAVLHGNRVVASSLAARADGVVAGQRRREAQARCPDLAVVDHDPVRDARQFEPVVAAVETVTPLIEIVAPGHCALATRGPARYHGGEAAMMALLEHRVGAVLADRGVAQVGTADGSFAATLAARHPDPLARHVPAGGSAAFLAPLPVSVLGIPDLTSVLERLGLVTLGGFAALDHRDVVARFGPIGAVSHRLASGLDEHPPDAARVPPSFEVAVELDPPAERVDQAAFIAKTLADRLHERLDASGLGCTLLGIHAETEHGERLERRWRHEGALTPGAIADRARWQLEGWLNGPVVSRPTGGISRLVLVPDEVRPATGRQLGFWGGQSAEGERAARAVARVQATLGHGSVAVPEPRGGREPTDQVVLVPAEAVELTALRPRHVHATRSAPWPGALPLPSPAVIHPDPVPAVVLGADDTVVRVDGRGVPSGHPDHLAIDGRAPRPVVAWAGPWPVDERWWDPVTRRRRARYQMVTDDGVAHLVVLDRGRWLVTATYA